MSKRVNAIVWAVVFIIPFILGIIGFMPVYDYDISWAAYSSLRLYGANVDIDAGNSNLFIDLARWSSLLVMARLVLSIFQTVTERLVSFVKSLSRNSCAVYGSSAYAECLVKNLGGRGIAAGEKLVSGAGNHVLLFDTDRENLDFYAKHKDLTKKKHVCIMLNEITPHCMSEVNLNVFSMYENCARLYWKSNPLFWEQNEKKVAIIGFGSLGREILKSGLLFNINKVGQGIEYHIWGESEDFLGLHQNLRENINSDRLKDKLIFHTENWQCGLADEPCLDRIILCMDAAANLINLSMILSYICCSKLHIYVDSGERVNAFPNESNITPFGMAEDLFTREVILKESLLENAKKRHEKYRAENPGTKDWNELDGFTKRSNISAADYEPELDRLRLSGVPEEELDELEHIRWCRFHYLNNWRYAPEKNPKEKTHHGLMDYSEYKKQLRLRLEQI